MTAPAKITRKAKFDLANRIRLDGKLTPADRLVGWFIADHINTHRGYAWPTQLQVATELGISTRSVKRAVKALALASYFQVNRLGRANEYHPANGNNLSPIATKNRGQKRPGKVTKTTEIGDKKDPPSLEHPFNILSVPKGADSANSKFEEFRKSYPTRKGSQGWPAAQKHFEAAIKSGTEPDHLVRAAGKFAASLSADTVGTHFVPMAETWLRKGNWREYLPSPADIEKERQITTDMKARGYEWIDDKWTKISMPFAVVRGDKA